jgi:predicted nucleic acid-binding protein
MAERKLVNFNNLDREAQLYREAKINIDENVKILRETIDTNTKPEVEAVQEAIKNLNKKVERIMETDFVKEKTQIIERSEKQMIQSITSAAETFFKVSQIIREKEGLSEDHKHEYQTKLYDKIIDKFMTKEEKEIFNKLVNSGKIFMGRNNKMIGSQSMLGLLN